MSLHICVAASLHTSSGMGLAEAEMVLATLV